MDQGRRTTDDGRRATNKARQAMDDGRWMRDHGRQTTDVHPLGGKGGEGERREGKGYEGGGEG